MALARMLYRGPSRSSALVARFCSGQRLFGKNGENIELCLDDNSEFMRGHKPTISFVGPSRKGKSVNAGLLVRNHKAFPYSHSASHPKTSGTDICASGEPGIPFWVVDCEGVSHTKGPQGMLVAKKLLSATYLISSWIVWFDSNVMEDSFFGSMQLVSEYMGNVVPCEKRPNLLYVRTCETAMSRMGYGDFDNFTEYFAHETKNNQEFVKMAPMFRQMVGFSLPEFVKADLDAHESDVFWTDDHASPYKEAFKHIKRHLMTDSIAPPLPVEGVKLQLPKINKLAAVDYHAYVKQRLETYVEEQFKQFQVDASDAVSLDASARRFCFCEKTIESAFNKCKQAVLLQHASDVEASFLEALPIYLAMQQNKEAMLAHCKDTWAQISLEAANKFGCPTDIISVVDACWRSAVKGLPSVEFASWLSVECSKRGVKEADAKLSSLLQPFVLNLGSGCSADTIYEHLSSIKLESEKSILMEAVVQYSLDPDVVETMLAKRIGKIEEHFMVNTKHCIDLGSLRRLRVYQDMVSKKAHIVYCLRCKNPFKVYLQHAPSVVGKLSAVFGSAGSGAGAAAVVRLAAAPAGLAASVVGAVGYAAAASYSEYLAWNLGSWDIDSKTQDLMLWVSSDGLSWYLFEREFYDKDCEWYGNYLDDGRVNSGGKKLPVPKDPK